MGFFVLLGIISISAMDTFTKFALISDAPLYVLLIIERSFPFVIIAIYAENTKSHLSKFIYNPNWTQYFFNKTNKHISSEMPNGLRNQRRVLGNTTATQDLYF